MIIRFCLYSILKNLRFADPFLVLFLLHVELSLTQIGIAPGAQHLPTGTLEVPLGANQGRSFLVRDPTIWAPVVDGQDRWGPGTEFSRHSVASGHGALQDRSE